MAQYVHRPIAEVRICASQPWLMSRALKKAAFIVRDASLVADT